MLVLLKGPPSLQTLSHRAKLPTRVYTGLTFPLFFLIVVNNHKKMLSQVYLHRSLLNLCN